MHSTWQCSSCCRWCSCDVSTPTLSASTGCCGWWRGRSSASPRWRCRKACTTTCRAPTPPPSACTSTRRWPSSPSPGSRRHGRSVPGTRCCPRTCVTWRGMSSSCRRSSCSGSWPRLLDMLPTAEERVRWQAQATVSLAVLRAVSLSLAALLTRELGPVLVVLLAFVAFKAAAAAGLRGPVPRPARAASAPGCACGSVAIRGAVRGGGGPLYPAHAVGSVGGCGAFSAGPVCRVLHRRGARAADEPVSPVGQLRLSAGDEPPACRGRHRRHARAQQPRQHHGRRARVPAVRPRLRPGGGSRHAGLHRRLPGCRPCDAGMHHRHRRPHHRALERDAAAAPVDVRDAAQRHGAGPRRVAQLDCGR